MACGGDREIEIGTDEYFDFLCSVCKIKKKKTEGKYLCLDCHDYYCFNCVKCHEEIPFLKNHKVVGTEIINPGPNIKFQALPGHDNETHANSSGDTVPQTEPDVSLGEFIEVNDVIVIKKANYERMQKERRETTEQMEQILVENQFEIEWQKQLNRDLSIDRDRKVEALNMLKKHYEASEHNKDQFSKQTESLQIKLAQQESFIDHLRRNVDTLSAELEDNRLNLDKQTACREKLKKENVTLNESIATLTSDLATANEKIASLREELNAKKADVKKLQTEKDELSGRNAVLAEEAELIKKHYEASEQNMDQFSKQSESLQIKLAQQESLINHLRRKVVTLSSDLEDNRLNLDKQTASSVQDKEWHDKRLQELEERVKNAEDKRMAAEASKAMLQEEIVTFEVTQAEMSNQIEKTRAECASLKEKLCRLEEEFTQKSKIQAIEMEQNLHDLVAAVSEKESLQKENSNLKQQLTLTFERTVEGSILIMKQSLTQIKERLEKKEKECRSLEKAMKSREQDYLEREHEMQSEIENLIEKILMCGEEYKDLYFEKNKVKKKMERLATKLKEKQGNEQQMDFTVSQQTDMQLVEQQIATQIEEFKKAVDTKILEMDKYKNLYKEERVKNEQMLKKFHEELLEKEAEIARLKMRIRDIPNDNDLKMRALEDENNISPERSAPFQKENKWVWNVPIRNPGVQKVNPPTGGQVDTPVMSFPVESGSPPVVTCRGSPLVHQHPAYPHAIKSQVPPVPPRTRISGKDQIKTDHTVYECGDSNKKLDELLVVDVAQEMNVDIPQPEKSTTCKWPSKNGRFYDAEGSAMKLCSECNKTFPADVEEEVFLEHQMSHLGTLCLVCKMFKPENMTDDDFEKHVNKHYADEDGAGIY